MHRSFVGESSALPRTPLPQDDIPLYRYWPVFSRIETLRSDDASERTRRPSLPVPAQALMSLCHVSLWVPVTLVLCREFRGPHIILLLPL